MDERLKRVHVVNVRQSRDTFFVILSDPEIDDHGNSIANPDCWEVPWSSWVRSGGSVEDL